jgi:hypothetical protein
MCDAGRVRRISRRRLSAVRQLSYSGMKQLQHRDAIAVSLLVFEKASQLALVECANPVSQFGQRQLVVVR